MPAPARPSRASSRLGTTLTLVAAIVLAGCGLSEPAPTTGDRPSAPAPSTTSAPPTPRDGRVAAVPATPAAPAPAVPAALVDGALDLRSGPVPVPIELELPSVGIHATVLGVGLSESDDMDAPTGPLDDPVWDQAFWYRGSAVPGAASTALIAGHVGSRGGPAIFDRLDELVPGDPVVVHDLRTGVGVRFVVTESAEYSLEEAAQPEILTRIYGAGPVAGTWPQPSADGLAHLTLVTCAGTFRGETHDHRRVVYAVAAP